jgi:hypothetical protein
MKPFPYTDIKQKVANIVIREYVAHSYLYYEKDSPIIDDGQFDKLCKWIEENYDWIKPFDINNYLEESEIHAGSGFVAASKITGPTQRYAEYLLEGASLARDEKEGKETKHISKLYTKPRPKPKEVDEDDPLGL